MSAYSSFRDLSVCLSGPQAVGFFSEGGALPPSVRRCHEEGSVQTLESLCLARPYLCRLLAVSRGEHFLTPGASDSSLRVEEQ